MSTCGKTVNDLNENVKDLNENQKDLNEVLIFVGI